MSDEARTEPDPDADLLPAARAGDAAALDALLRRHQQRLHALCRRLTDDPDDALDALQEAMIAIVRGLPRFDGRSRASTWMHRVATNACLDEMRRRRRRRADPLPEDEGEAVGVAEDDRVVDRDRLDAALAQLTPEFRTAVVLRDVLGHDYGEIADILGVAPGTVRSRISRGRAALARSLDGNHPAPSQRPTLQP